ncbi:MAG: hypothetical protein LBL96_04055 [Clostridiales bacterium]|nr:hypothetical protein [Clostridiales bacterium]
MSHLNITAFRFAKRLAVVLILIAVALAGYFLGQRLFNDSQGKTYRATFVNNNIDKGVAEWIFI